MNDDFLYKRQEIPEPEFITKLQEELQSLELPEKTKRKNGQRHFNWKALAAGLVILLGGIFVLVQPEIQIPVMTMIYGYPNDDMLREAQVKMDFELPEIPNGYYIAIANKTDADIPHIFVNLQSYRGYCVISFSVLTNPQSPETLQQSHEYNSQLAEAFTWADIVQLGNGIEAVWRSTTYNGSPLATSLDWHFGDNSYHLASTEECSSQEELAAMAQSTLP